jgi:predicted acylesterase/phospholipase RssA
LLRASKHENISKDKTLRLRVYQQLALCTYKDQDLPEDERFSRALSILDEVEDRTTTTNQETLGLVGSIYKRIWEVDNQQQNLERSLSYYLRGYEQGPARDQGYTGINAAFVLDKLADLEDGENSSFSNAARRRERSRAIRQDIVNQVGALIDDPSHQWVTSMWWYYATVAESHFGLRNYEEAVRWLEKGRSAAGEINEWELESCVRQLASLARLQDVKGLKTGEFVSTPAWAAIKEAFGSATIAQTAFIGKIGLALSGGGFRASLYHLGVLARLAELDVLRHVEIISCVSGGSIVGAHYYLKLRYLLQTKTEDEIGRGDYIRIIHEMIDEFIRGVQKNIRMSVAVNPFKTIKMLWNEGYSRTNRAGELYEKYLYSLVKDGDQDSERWLNNLLISPLIRKDDGETEHCKEFSPKYQNWRRDAKVPILVLNAATLNTGHTWQFTASWMGESPAGIDTEVDGNDRLRRMYYSDAPDKYKRIRLGDAVAASAAVPGVFEPITLDGLYPEPYIVRLVDGGVCDNQGVASLLEQECKVLLVSDASGQMESQPASSRSIFGVLLRSNSIFQARIRTAQYHDLKGRRRSGLLNGLMFVHLKGDLEVDPIDWIDCPDPYDASDDGRPPSRRGVLTRYGIDKKMQECLSAIRTDLDSFSDAEAFALMTSGYRFTEYQFKQEKCVEGFTAPSDTENWKFLPIEQSMTVNGKGYKYLMKLLKAGSSNTFKVWVVDSRLRFVLFSLLLLILLTSGALVYLYWNEPVLSYPVTRTIQILDNVSGFTLKGIILLIFGGMIMRRLLASIVGNSSAKVIVRFVRRKDLLRRALTFAFVSTVGWAVSIIHLWIFDRLFLRLGSMDTLKKK